MLNIAEGAGRRSSPDKRRFYEIARDSTTETAAVIDVLAARKLATPAKWQLFALSRDSRSDADAPGWPSKISPLRSLSLRPWAWPWPIPPSGPCPDPARPHRSRHYISIEIPILGSAERPVSRSTYHDIPGPDIRRNPAPKPREPGSPPLTTPHIGRKPDPLKAIFPARPRPRSPLVGPSSPELIERTAHPEPSVQDVCILSSCSMSGARAASDRPSPGLRAGASRTSAAGHGNATGLVNAASWTPPVQPAARRSHASDDGGTMRFGDRGRFASPGNTHCHGHSRATFGYLMRRAPGTSTHPGRSRGPPRAGRGPRGGAWRAARQAGAAAS